ncbi:diguanylate cyclase [Butyrivibrio sp. CB08]|uniref:diguanylate cyclase domain-containing protein n=1 Tax=Butyrivibrio sp. CB08 TaxID=2364879 RepID=UPI000EA9CEA7|nr:diguanylate cyclase [Butyrivibrio sp. CB08]RKM60596.1 diguanylate cyclase [Butyrivibrio sp. CB08]
MDYSIVVVDDDSLILENVRMLLSQESMHVTCIDSGERLLKYVESHTPDLILLDIMMPEMDGFDTYIALKKFEDHTGRRHIPVIFMSGDETSDSEEMSLVMGASDYITKPFNKDILIRRIEHTVKNSKTIENLTEEATLDRLTGFLNKTKGTDRVSKLCKRKIGSLMIFDLDSFKLVNDLFGHEMGDNILKTFADVVRHNTRETDTLCRIGGDEFMAFFEDLTDQSVVASLSKRLNNQLMAEANRLMGEDHGIPLGVSMGVVMIPDDGRDYEALFALADSELYKVKQNGKHGFSIHREETAADQDGEEDALSKLDRIERILEERNDKEGALILGKDSFTVAYRFVMRLYRRYGGSAALLLFDLHPQNDDDYNYLIEVVQSFCGILEKTLRMSDIVMQNSSHSFFILVTECTEPEVESAIRRILEAYEEVQYNEKVKVEYVFKYSAKTRKKK